MIAARVKNRKTLKTTSPTWQLSDFWTRFSKSPSFKITMSGQVGGCVGGLPRLTFLLTFFQSCMLPLFFSGLPLYLVGMKKRTSRCFPCKRDNSHFLHYLKNPSIMLLGVFLFKIISQKFLLFSFTKIAKIVPLQ